MLRRIWKGYITEGQNEICGTGKNWIDQYELMGLAKYTEKEAVLKERNEFPDAVG